MKWLPCILAGFLAAAPCIFAQESANPLREALQASRAALADGDPAAATTTAAEAVKADPGSFDAWKQYGRALQLSYKGNEALEAYRTALALRPEDPDIDRWRVELWIETLRGADLREKLASLPPKTWENLGREPLASHTLRLWESDRAVDARLLLELASDTADIADIHKVLDALAQGDRAPAEAHLARDEPHPFHPTLAYALAMDALRRGHLNQALDDLDRAETILAGQHSIRRERGWALYRLGRFRDAEAAWSPEDTDAPPPIEWRLWIARAQYADDRNAEALDAIDIFLNEFPEHLEALSLKGHVILDLEDPETAEAFFNRLPDESLRRTVSAVARMRHEKARGNHEQAAAHIQPLLENEELPAFLKTEYEQLLLQWADATPPGQRWQVLERAVAWQPERIDFQRDYGWSLWAAGQTLEAVEVLDAALSHGLEPRESTLLQAVARLVEEGELERAVRLFNTHKDDADLGAFGRELIHKNRINASRAILELAWDQGDRHPLTGLYLGYALALAGQCEDLLPRLQPFLADLAEDTDPTQTDMLLEILHQCERYPELIALLQDAPLLQDPKQPHAAKVTDLMREHALFLLARHRHEDALPHLLRILERDPERPLWSRAIETAQRAQQPATAAKLMSDAPLDLLPGWEIARVRGLRALEGEDPAAAAKAYEESLAQNPEQLDLLIRQFQLLLSLGEHVAATHWMEVLRVRVDTGTAPAADLAHMLDQLGRPAESNFYWELARAQSPEIPYYTLSAARSLAEACKTYEALALLLSHLDATPDPNLYAYAAELSLALGDTREAANHADAGLTMDAQHPALLRFRAELAEQLDEGDLAVDLARRALREQPASNALRLLLGRTLMKAERFEEARAHYESLLSEPSLEARALTRLRDLHALRGETAKALAHAQRLSDLHPDDPEITRLLAASLAEDRRFQPALRHLGSLTARPVSDAVPVLLFSHISRCPLPGTHSVESVGLLLDRLSEAGWTFLDPEALQTPPAVGSRQVLLVFDQVPYRVLPDLTQRLEAHQARAFLHRPPRFPSHFPVTERWEILEDLNEADPAFHLPGSSPDTLSAKRVPPAWTSEDLLRHLTQKNPLVQARLTKAKTLYWHNQAPRADHWFLEARALGADPFEVSFNRGMNALRAGDFALARVELDQAALLRPDHTAAAEHLASIDQKRNPALEGRYLRRVDSDHRNFTRRGLQASGYVSPNIQLFGAVEQLRHARRGMGEEEGWRTGIGVKTHVNELTEFDAILRYTQMDDAENFVGWDTRLRLPSQRMRGHLDLGLSRGDVETVEAVREGITQDHARAHAYSRVHNLWDVFLNADGLFRSDGNHTGQLEGRFIFRLNEAPYLGAGLLTRFADSEEDSDLYYTPRELQKHMLYLNLRGRASDLFRYSLSGEAGTAREAGDDWMFVWGARGELGWEFANNLEFVGGASYMETPRYDMRTYFIAVRLIP
ncbi:MAG: tetratricopeptide repeat protein [Kiritimatiellae bacterium]|nr:tetratricopeptide repeat protein [Kiritimatiellia bacterium]